MLFVKICGIKVFYKPRFNPDGIDVNVRCLNPRPVVMTITKFDGQNRQENADKLAYKSAET